MVKHFNSSFTSSLYRLGLGFKPPPTHHTTAEADVEAAMGPVVTARPRSSIVRSIDWLGSGSDRLRIKPQTISSQPLEFEHLNGRWWSVLFAFYHLYPTLTHAVISDASINKCMKPPVLRPASLAPFERRDCRLPRSAHPPGGGAAAGGVAPTVPSRTGHVHMSMHKPYGRAPRTDTKSTDPVDWLEQRAALASAIISSVTSAA